MKKMILRMGLAVLVAVSLSANASQFRFHDYSESPDVAWLTVDGTQVTGDGSYGSGTIANFLITPYGSLDVGERISFDYQLTGNGSAPGIVYTQLLGASDEPGLISDEFLLWTSGSGLYHVDFISYDSASGVMSSEHPDLVPLPDPTSFIELPEWQLVGTIDPFPGPGTTLDTFEVMSVPEPATFGLLALGGLALAAYRRRSK